LSERIANLTVDRIFVALVQRASQPIVGWRFESSGYGKTDFPWPESAWAEFLTPLPEPIDAPSKNVEERERSPLCWLWDEALAEWQA
jgi:hypothetical protein